MEALAKLSKDLKESAKLIGHNEARYLVDLYYEIQDFRIQMASQVRSAGKGEPCAVLNWCFDNTKILENNIKRSLDLFSSEYAVGLWLKSNCGIGPVISAGFLTHLDVRDRPTAGHFWRFAGLDPSVKWEKKTKRPWNAKLKCLCWKAGESFVIQQGRDSCFYGHLFRARKDMEVEKNESGDHAELAAKQVEEKRYSKGTEAIKWIQSGVLPPAHIHARARRYTIKIFLSHLHHVMHVDYYGKEPVKPYVFEKSEGDHRHFIEIPNFPSDLGGKSLAEMFKQ
jgi:hypothetical protein